MMLSRVGGWVWPRLARGVAVVAVVPREEIADDLAHRGQGSRGEGEARRDRNPFHVGGARTGWRWCFLNCHSNILHPKVAEQDHAKIATAARARPNAIPAKIAKPNDTDAMPRRCPTRDSFSRRRPR